jgi:hypothetical protein
MKKILMVLVCMGVGFAAFAQQNVVVPSVTTADGKVTATTGFVATAETLKITNYTATNRTDVTIPDQIGGVKVTSIGAGAFRGYPNVVTIRIPATVTDINPQAFDGCLRLDKIIIEDSPNYEALTKDKSVYFADEYGVLYNKEKTKLIACPRGKTGAYTLLGSITTIGSYAFAKFTNLTVVTLPPDITTLEDHAFEGCENLETMNLPENLATIGEYAFAGCTKLVAINIPASLTDVKAGAFARIPGFDPSQAEKLTAVGPDAFTDGPAQPAN